MKTISPQTRHVRVIGHQPDCTAIRFAIPLVRPSVLDSRLMGDPWIEAQGEEQLSVCFNNCLLVALSGLAPDLPMFNELLDRLRHRPPRQRLGRAS